MIFFYFSQTNSLCFAQNIIDVAFVCLLPLFQMAFSKSNKSLGRTPGRSHSAIHIATSRDYDRKKLAEKHEVKLEKDYDALERKMMSRAKWNHRAESNQVRLSTTGTASLDDYIQRERAKQENIIKAKQAGNEGIRRTSVNLVPKI